MCFAKHVLRKNSLGPKSGPLFFYVGLGLTQPYRLDPPGLTGY